MRAAAGSRPKELVGLRGLARLPAWSPDGRTLAFLGTDVPGAPDHAEIELFVWDGGEPRSLTGALDLPVTLAWGSDLHDWMGPEMPAPILGRPGAGRPDQPPRSR